MKDLHTHTRFDRLMRSRRPKTRKRLKSLRAFKKRKEELVKLTNELEELWQRLIKKGATKLNLSSIIQDVELPPLQIEALREFLKRDDLVFDDFNDILDPVEKLFKEIKDGPLKNEFWQKCFEATLPEDLVFLIEFKEGLIGKKAWQELDDRIQNGSIRKGQAWQILIQIMEKCPEEKSRMRVWERIERLNPSREVLLHIRDLPFIDSMPPLAKKIEKLLRKKHKRKEPNTRIINKIGEIVEEITKLEKGQE